MIRAFFQKQIGVIVLGITLLSSFGTIAQDSTFIRRFLVDAAYEQYKTLELKEEMSLPSRKSSFTTYNEQSPFSSDIFIEDIKKSLKTLSLIEDSFQAQDRVSISIEKGTFINKRYKKNVEVSLVFTSVLDNLEQEIIVPGQTKQLMQEFLNKSTYSPVFTESIDVIRELEKGECKSIKGIMLVRYKETLGEIILNSHETGVSKKLGETFYKVVRFDKNGVIIEIFGEDSSTDFTYLNKEGEQFANFSSRKGNIQIDELTSIFKKYEGLISKKELENIADNLDHELVSKQLKKKEEAKKYLMVALGQSPDKIIIKRYGHMKQQEFPFEVLNTENK